MTTSPFQVSKTQKMEGAFLGARLRRDSRWNSRQVVVECHPGRSSCPAGRDQVPGPAGADPDTVPWCHLVGDKVHISGGRGTVWTWDFGNHGVWKSEREKNLCFTFSLQLYLKKD